MLNYSFVSYQFSKLVYYVDHFIARKSFTVQFFLLIPRPTQKKLFCVLVFCFFRNSLFANLVEHAIEEAYLHFVNTGRKQETEENKILGQRRHTKMMPTMGFEYL